MNCTGSIKRGSACFTCDRCMNYFEKIVLKYRKTPMIEIPKSDFMIFSASIQMLSQKLGPTGFKDFITGAK